MSYKSFSIFFYDDIFFFYWYISGIVEVYRLAKRVYRSFREKKEGERDVHTSYKSFLCQVLVNNCPDHASVILVYVYYMYGRC